MAVNQSVKTTVQKQRNMAEIIKGLAQKLENVNSDSGFYILKGHGISEKTVSDCYSAARLFLNCRWKKNGNQTS
eukprot:UN22768